MKEKQKMNNSIAFIGGIHGVGKSTICRKICNELPLEYLSASELIKWNNINEDNQNKKVWDISLTQDRLVVGLENRVQKNKSYLLDGHYCLFNNENEIVNIPLGTFKLINPFSLNIILGDIIKIKNGLEKRDNRQYDQELLAQMQERELDHAKYLSKALGIVLNIGNQDDYSDILSSLRFQVSKKNDNHS